RADVIELLLLADEGVKRDLDLLAVEIARIVEQVGLEQLDGRVEGRADAEAGNAGMLASVRERRPDGVDAVAGAQIIPERDIGGRIAELATALVARLDNAFDRIVAAHQLGCGGGVAGLQSFANSAGGDAEIAERNRCDRFGDDAASLSKGAQRLDIALPAAAEREVIAGDNASGADLLGQHVIDEIF